MEIKYICPLWGSEHMDLNDFFIKVLENGFDGVEMVLPFDDDYTGFVRDLIARTGMILIGHQHLPPKIETAGDYLERMEAFLLHLASFDPMLINSHTGRDFYSFEDNCRIIEQVAKISESSGIPIVHETHRGRFSFSTYTTKLYFDKFPELKIAADFSHWCCVSESLLEDQEAILTEAINRSAHIHARVGNSESPQVNHPGAPEHRTALERHLHWWQQIVDKRKEEGCKILTITTEFGPEPYLQTLPFTNKPVADQWEVNVFMKDFLKENLLI